RQVEAAADFFGKLHDGDRAVRAGDDKAAIFELDVGGGRLQHVGGDLLALFDHLGGGFDDRGAAVHEAFGAARSPTRVQAIAIALHQPDFFKRNAELVA